MNISKKHRSRFNGRKSFLRLGVCLTTAALMGTMAVTASAEEEVKRLVTAPYSISYNLRDGYFITQDGDFVYMDEDVFANWRDTGKLEFKAAESDLNINDIGFWSGKLSDGDYVQLFSKDTNGNPAQRYVMKCDKENHKFTTIQTFGSEWCFTTSDGYTFKTETDIESGTINYSVVKPDGTTVQNSLKSYVYHPEDANQNSFVEYHSCAAENGKYCAYITVDEERDEENNFGNYALYGIDRNGDAVKLYDDIKARSFQTTKCINDNIVTLFIMGDGDYRAIVYSVDNDTTKTAYLMYSYWGDFNYADDSRLIHSYEFEGVSHANLYDLDDPHSNTRSSQYKNIYSQDGEIYLVQNGDDKWGYIDRNGNELAIFDDASEFIGDYAPVVQNGKAFLIDKNMNRVSEKIDASGVSIVDDGLYRVVNGDDSFLVTYADEPVSESTETSKPIQNSKPADTSKTEENPDSLPSFFSAKVNKTDESSVQDGVVTSNETSSATITSSDNANPPTGAGSIALAVGALTVTGAVIIAARKKK